MRTITMTDLPCNGRTSAAIIIHGFNVSDGGRSTVGTLTLFLQPPGIVPI